MKDFLLQFFTWWNGQTLGTRYFTWARGELVGEDDFGNRYYRQRKGPGARRWVIYRGLAEPSKVPAEWHGWLHKTVDEPPAKDLPRRPWQKPHKPNLTGTPGAYRPSGSVLRASERPQATGDYQPWTPE